ncbi:hypothetical protein JOB18_014082 [Solea senegalensis]|uniref:Uncharacterized protein n=1 Tax=Solea senegalensis TaxID=28829 RepID=A0AAV6Q878_SOLSE|nr:hypothetical protein JOB18_014082 [Solea senegalensis]
MEGTRERACSTWTNHVPGSSQQRYNAATLPSREKSSVSSSLTSTVSERITFPGEAPHPHAPWPSLPSSPWVVTFKAERSAPWMTSRVMEMDRIKGHAPIIVNR